MEKQERRTVSGLGEIVKHAAATTTLRVILAGTICALLGLGIGYFFGLLHVRNACPNIVNDNTQLRRNVEQLEGQVRRQEEAIREYQTYRTRPTVHAR